jgi:hypothetical protein
MGQGPLEKQSHAQQVSHFRILTYVIENTDGYRENQSARSVGIRDQLMLLRLTKIQRKTIGIYVPILLHDLGCRPGGGSQKQGIDASRAMPVQEIAK